MVIITHLCVLSYVMLLLQEEYETVLYCNQTTAGRNRKLLDILSTKGPNGFNEFRNSLMNDFKWLADVLDSTARPEHVELPSQSHTIASSVTS